MLIKQFLKSRNIERKKVKISVQFLLPSNSFLSLEVIVAMAALPCIYIYTYVCLPGHT